MKKARDCNLCSGKRSRKRSRGTGGREKVVRGGERGGAGITRMKCLGSSHLNCPTNARSASVSARRGPSMVSCSGGAVGAPRADPGVPSEWR